MSTVFAAFAAVVFSGLQPQLAAVGDRVYLVFGQGDLVSVAGSSDGGNTFEKSTALPAPAGWRWECAVVRASR